MGEAATPAAALVLVRSAAAPDVVFIDTDQTVEPALELSRRIAQDTAVILLASSVDPAVIVEAMHAGARGLLLKHTDGDHIVEAVEIVAGEGTYFSPSAAVAIQEWLRSGQPGADPIDRLSEQERRIVLLIAEGKTNRTIAAALHLSEYTVKTYVSSALRKLGFRSRAQVAAAIAQRQSAATHPPAV